MAISKLDGFLVHPALRRLLLPVIRSAESAPRGRISTCLALLLTGHLALAAAVTEVSSPALPPWQTLEYEQSAFWVTARSSVTIKASAENPQNWLLSATSSVASNSEEVEVTLEATSGRALHRSRLSQGKQQRYKSYEFLPDHILRERREPGADPAQAPAEWPLSSSRNTPYPAPPLTGGMVITDAYALLHLAGQFQHCAADSSEVVINTDANFYRVRMTHGQDSTLKVNYQVRGQDSAITGKRDASAVILSISPVGEAPDKPDFSLLGLNGDITVVFDQASGLPLQLRGNAPRIGATEINLRSVTLLEPAA